MNLCSSPILPPCKSGQSKSRRMFLYLLIHRPYYYYLFSLLLSCSITHTSQQNKNKIDTEWSLTSKNPEKYQGQTKILQVMEHDSVVCCVAFSADGKYLATGSNKSNIRSLYISRKDTEQL